MSCTHYFSFSSQYLLGMKLLKDWSLCQPTKSELSLRLTMSKVILFRATVIFIWNLCPLYTFVVLFYL